MCIFGIFEGSFRFTVSSNLKAVSMFLYLVADVLDPPASILTILMRLSRLSVSFWELLYSDYFHYLRGSFRTFLYYLIRYTPSCSWWHWCSVPSWLISAGFDVYIFTFLFQISSYDFSAIQSDASASVKELI